MATGQVEIMPQEKSLEFPSEFINRVVSYPTVHSLLTGALSYYSTAKDSNVIVKKSLETVENNLHQTYQWVSPSLNSELAKKYGTAVDQFGCKQLDKIEKQVETTKQAVRNTKEVAANLKNKASEVIEDKMQYIEAQITPVDQYLKHSVIALPLNVALDITEKVCDRLLPENVENDKKVDEETKEQLANAGPIIRTTTLSKRLQKKAFSKLHDLRLRSSDKVQSMTHVVDLIQYAAQNLDAGVKKTNKLLGDSIHMGIDASTTSVKYIKDVPAKLAENPSIKQVSDKVNAATTEAIHALHLAVEVLSHQIPQPLTDTTVNTLRTIVNKTKDLSASIEASNMQLFSSIASKGSEKLKEVGSLLSSFQNKQDPEHLPQSLVASIASTITGVLDSLAAVLKPNAQFSDADAPLVISGSKTQ